MIKDFIRRTWIRLATINFKDLSRNTPFRIAAIYAVMFSLSVVVLLTTIYLVAKVDFLDALRDRIRYESSILENIYKQEGLEELADAIRERTAGNKDESFFYHLRESDGTRIAGNLPDLKFQSDWQEVTIQVQSDVGTELQDISIELFQTVLKADGLLVTGAHLERIKDLKEILLPAVWIALVLTGMLALGGGLFLSRAAFNRVSKITDSSRKIMDGNLSSRLPIHGSGDELDQLSGNINEMLEKIEALMEGMKQVTNDIAHDLRTPLGHLRQNLEGARDAKTDIAGYQAAFDRAIAETDEILDTFQALLRLGRISAGEARRRFATVALSELINGLAETYEAVAEDRKQKLATDIAPDISILGDERLLTQMLVNLLENAISHSPAGATISIALKNGADGPRVILSDTGPGIPESEHEKVFRPFYRLEKSRNSAGNGLGLALVKAIATQHDIEITLADNDSGLRVTLDLPANLPRSSAA